MVKSLNILLLGSENKTSELFPFILKFWSVLKVPQWLDFTYNFTIPARIHININVYVQHHDVSPKTGKCPSFSFISVLGDVNMHKGQMLMVLSKVK